MASGPFFNTSKKPVTFDNLYSFHFVRVHFAYLVANAAQGGSSAPARCSFYLTQCYVILRNPINSSALSSFHVVICTPCVIWQQLAQYQRNKRRGCNKGIVKVATWMRFKTSAGLDHEDGAVQPRHEDRRCAVGCDRPRPLQGPRHKRFHNPEWNALDHWLRGAHSADSVRHILHLISALFGVVLCLELFHVLFLCFPNISFPSITPLLCVYVIVSYSSKLLGCKLSARIRK
jgi:hypothetical protein